MLSEKKLREIKKYEEAGHNIVVIGSGGTLDYATQSIGGCEYCDQCSAFRLLPDPDPDDWIRDGDMKAVCLEVNGVIEGSLERPNEWTNIRKPLYCPKLGRELSEEEKKTAAERLKLAKEYKEASINVVAIGSGGTLDYATQGIGGCEYCDHCSAFRLLPDPDPDDWIRDGDMKAVCLEVNGVIEGSLERPNEWTNIRKPLYCPKLGRELSEEEKKTAAERLKLAKERMKRR